MATCNKQIVIEKVVASFVKVSEPVRKMSGEGREYSIQVIVSKDHPQLDNLKQAIGDIANEAFPGHQLAPDCRLLRDSDAEGKGDQYDYMKNTWFFNLRRNEKQGQVPFAMPSGEMRDPDPSVLFSGCLINVHVGLFDYAFRGPNGQIMKRGVSGSLNGIQLVDNVNVERLGGGAPVPQFGAIEGNVQEATTSPAQTAQAPVAVDEDQGGAPPAAVPIPW